MAQLYEYDKYSEKSLLQQRQQEIWIPSFAASGHNLYAKSAHVYLSKMLMLEKDHPTVHASRMVIMY